MSWTEVHTVVSAEEANELSNVLMELGAVAVTFQDAENQPIFEPTPDTPRIWHKTIVIGLFAEEQPLAPVLKLLATRFLDYQLHPVADEDWVRRSLEYFQPIRCGKRLWICPSWHVPPEPQHVNVILDPGLAFGTGSHPTTALCLEWLDAHISSGEQVIDYGCGSGILAIAALKLGAKHALAIDNDPNALIATRDNAIRNQLTTRQLETRLPTSDPVPPADILIANILAQPLIELAPKFASMCKINAKIILSGILNTQTKSIQDAYNPWFIIENQTEKEEWVCLSGVRK